MRRLPYLLMDKLGLIEQELYNPAIPLVRAVICLDCDCVSESVHESCGHCGSKATFPLTSVISLR